MEWYIKLVLGLMLLLTAVYSILNYIQTRQKVDPYKNDFMNNLSGKNTAHLMGFENKQSAAVLNRTYNKSTPLVIILLAYLHTGSTFTGSILQQHPGSFYRYEPLRSLEDDSKNGDVITYLNGTERRLQRGKGNHGNQIDTELGAEAVNNMATCQLELLDTGTLGRWWRNFSKRENPATNEYNNCLHPRQGANKLQPPSSINVKRCLPKLTRKCTQARIRVAKYIRMSMAMVEIILHKIDNIKVIQLVRDPRAMMDSQFRHKNHGSSHQSNFIVNTREICTKMIDDFKLLQELSERYPGKVKSLRYEDLVADPIKRARAMYNFAGLNFTETIKTFVSKESIDTKYTSQKKANVWRGNIQQKHINTVNVICEAVFSSFGYSQIQKLQNVRNTSYATYVAKSEISRSDLFL